MKHSTLQRNALFAGIMGAGAMFSAGLVVAQDDLTKLGIEEMVVTAQKREENLQAVPISISSLSANDIERRGVQSPRDLLATIPNMGGFEPPGGKGSMSVTMRGVAAGSPANLSVDTTTALYIDGVLLGKMVGAATDVAELERVEVLRGPQGTLYGRNSTGGAINFITRKPTGEFGGKITGTVGNKNLWGIRATLDTPTLGTEGEGLGTLKASLGAQTRERDGFQKNTTPVQRDFDSLDRQAWRLALRWEPTDAITVDYAYDRSKLDESNPLQSPVGLVPVAYNPTTGALTTSVQRLNGLIQAGDAAVNFGAGPLANAVSDPTFMRWLDSAKAIRSALSNLNRPGKRPSSAAYDARSNTMNDVKGHSLTAAWQFDDLGVLGDVEFKSITGWRKVMARNIGDLDGLDNTILPGMPGAMNDLAIATFYSLYANQETYKASPAAVTGLRAQTNKLWQLAEQFGGGYYVMDARSDFKQFSQELQMVGSTERLQYAIGLYYYEDDGIFGKGGSLRKAMAPIGGLQSATYKNDTDAKALYTQFTYTPDMLDDRLAVTVGYRHTEETKGIKYLYQDDGASRGTGVFTASGVNLSYTGAISPMANYGEHYEKDFRNDSGAVTLAFQATDDTNLFLRWASGYRSGGYNGETYRASKPDNPFKAETLDSWELGVKSDVVPGTLRVNASVFQIKTKDMQVSQLEADGVKLTSYMTNAGEAKRWGSEVEVQWSPTDNLLVAASWAHMSGDFEEYPNPCGTGNYVNVCLDGTKRALRAQSPEDQLSLVTDWVFASTDWADFMAHLEIFWQDRNYAAALWQGGYDQGKDASGTPRGTYPYIYDPVVLKERTLVNARIGMENVEFSNGTSLRASLWVRNAFDKEYNIYGMNLGNSLGLIVDQFGEPRTYGLDVVWEF